MGCEAANLFCSAEIVEPFFATGKVAISPLWIVANFIITGYNPYDISKQW